MFLLCCAAIAILYTPATVFIRWLIENYHISYLWHNYLIIAVVHTAILVVITPHYYMYISTDRFFYPFVLIVTALLISMFYLYILLYQMARKNANILSLEMRNQFFAFQSQQYHSLVEYIESTKRIRHDFRQQIATIQNLAKSEDMDALRSYLDKYEISASNTYSMLCSNPAVNAIASYYKELCTEHEIPISWALLLPKKLPIPEPEYCVMLGNLVENAIDASLLLEKDKRNISVISHMPTSSMLIVIVENNHRNIIQREKKHFRSSKHVHEAIGLSSIKQTVNHYHGDMSIDYDENLFSVNILLNLNEYQ